MSADQARCDMDGEAVGVLPRTGPLTDADFAHLSAEQMAYVMATEDDQPEPDDQTRSYIGACAGLVTLFAAVRSCLSLAKSWGWLQ